MIQQLGEADEKREQSRVGDVDKSHFRRTGARSADAARIDPSGAFDQSARYRVERVKRQAA